MSPDTHTLIAQVRAFSVESERTRVRLRILARRVTDQVRVMKSQSGDLREQVEQSAVATDEQHALESHPDCIGGVTAEERVVTG